jgi:bifunctional non-homologous end joining protein LigD
MAATRWPEVFADESWRWELKWDGVRVLLFHDGADVTLRSRAGNDVTTTYPELTRIKARRRLVLDGEVVALDEAGIPSFGRLQGRMNVDSPRLVAAAVTDIPISYVVFDVLHDGVEVITEPWEQRRGRLAALDLPDPMVQSEVFMDPGPMWSFVRERGLEGLVAKRLGSRYRPGRRSPDWRKVPALLSTRAVVAGWTPGSGSRSTTFGALLLGLWHGDRLRFVGSVGTGFDDLALRAIRSTLDELGSDHPAFSADADLPDGAVWVEPRLVAVVQSRGWTTAGRLRAPSFKGFTDQPITSITWTAEGPAT